MSKSQIKKPSEVNLRKAQTGIPIFSFREIDSFVSERAEIDDSSPALSNGGIKRKRNNEGSKKENIFADSEMMIFYALNQDKENITPTSDKQTKLEDEESNIFTTVQKTLYWPIFPDADKGSVSSSKTSAMEDVDAMLFAALLGGDVMTGDETQ